MPQNQTKSKPFLEQHQWQGEGRFDSWATTGLLHNLTREAYLA